MQVLVLAGGRGMRLLPLTNDSPPPLLYLPGGSILDYTLHQARELSSSRTALVLQYQGDRIARRLAGNSSLHLIPQNPPFTLLSALASAADWVEEPTLVLHANHYFSKSLWPIIQKADPNVPTFLIPRDGIVRRSIAETGAYLLPPSAFRLAQRAEQADNLEALWNLLIEMRMQPELMPIEGWTKGIHTPSDLLSVNHYLLRNWHETMHPRDAGVGYDAMNLNWIAPDAKVDGSVPGFFVTIGPGASVTQSYLYNALVFPGVQLHHTKQQNVVLVENQSSLLRLYSTGAQPG